MIARELPIPRQLQQELDRELAPGERVLWSGQPLPKRYTRGSWAAVLFGIPWTAFAVFWTCMAFFGTRAIPGDHAMAMGFRWFFPLFGVPFILIGLGLLSSPWWGRRKAAGVLYAITDRRVLISEPGWRGARAVKSFEPEELQTLERTEQADGSGDLIFSRRSWRDRHGDHRATAVGFIGLPRVREVEAQLRKLIAQTRPPAVPLS
jgi:hypothetical protein